jgi:hypothetical protein
MNNGKIMNAPALYLLGLGVAAIFNGCLPGTASENDSAKPAIPYCKTWECDSMVVRAILVGNGQPNGRIDRGDGDRITWLSFAGIDNVPPEIGRLDGLEYLVLGGDFLELPGSMEQLRSLNYLELRSDSLNDIGEWLGNLYFLETLIISSSSLNVLPKSATKLRFLRWMRLSDNSFESLPEGIGNFVALEDLELDNNRLRILPDEIGNCTRLTSLRLSDNQLESLPAAIGKLTELTHLSLRDNLIREFPEEITNLKKIENIDMYGLPFCEPSQNVRNWLDIVNEGWERQIPASACTGI